MTAVCATQIPVGLGLRKVASSSKLVASIRKRAAVPQARGFIDKLPNNFPVQRPPVQEAQPVQPTQQTQSQQPVQQAPVAQQPQPTVTAQSSPGLGDRLSDIWNFIKHGINMLWYRKGMKEGTLTPEQWKRVQESASSLGSNRTLQDLYGLWYGKEKGAEQFKRISGLAGVTQNMPHLYKLRDLFKDGMSPGAISAGRNYWKENNLNLDDLKSTLDYGKQYGYVTDDDYKNYTSNLENLNTIAGF